jgi:hypothetical protein
MPQNLPKQNPQIPSALIWAQCITFVALYAVWMLYELMYFRRILLISGAVLALYPIYQYRAFFLKKRALPLWLMVSLFMWALFHLFFLSQDYPEQLMELRRIWKYASLGAVFALGLGLSIASIRSNSVNCKLFYFGLCSPLVIYLARYLLNVWGEEVGITIPSILRAYVPKTDYVAFCLPVLALTLGKISRNITLEASSGRRLPVEVVIYLTAIIFTLFIFYIQDTKNGIIYSVLFILIFIGITFSKKSSLMPHSKLMLIIVSSLVILATTYPHVQKNESWKSLIADVKVGMQLDKYPQWRYADEAGFPVNEYGNVVAGGNYLRAAWFKVGIKLAIENPLGYGLIEDSFKKFVKERWPDSSHRLSHSHSGWLDITLGIGFPGLVLIITALTLTIFQAKNSTTYWGQMMLWPLLANLLLWFTTEVSATITFCLLIFWIILASGLMLAEGNKGIDDRKRYY